MSLAFISLGSNVGDGLKKLTIGWRLLGGVDGITLLALSSPYITKPVPKEEWLSSGQQLSDTPFTNAVGVIETSLAPHSLLAETASVELQLGRNRETTVDRSLDLDLIYYDDLVLSDPDITIPHPEMHKRHFVLVPLAELAPDRIHPVLGISTSMMLRSLPHADSTIISRTRWLAQKEIEG